MNIFLTSFDPKEAASHLDDLRLNKMILETAQLLSCAYRHLFGENAVLYRDTHFNHPCTIWARKNRENYSWLVAYFDALAKEKMKRDKLVGKKNVKPHKSWEMLFEVLSAKKVKGFGDVVFDFNCTDFKEEKDVRIAYRKQLLKKWEGDLREPKWSGKKRPVF